MTMASSVLMVVTLYVHPLCVIRVHQVGNNHALEFYIRHGFAVVGEIENYYKRIEPRNCLVLRRPLVVVLQKQESETPM